MKKVTTTPATKKARKQSATQVAKSKANANKKAFDFSVSGLIRYAKNEGAKDLQKLVDETNAKHGTNVSASRVADKRTILKFYGTTKDGEKRTRFSYYNHLLTCVSKLAQEQKQANKRPAPKAVTIRRKAAKAA